MKINSLCVRMVFISKRRVPYFVQGRNAFYLRKMIIQDRRQTGQEILFINNWKK